MPVRPDSRKFLDEIQRWVLRAAALCTVVFACVALGLTWMLQEGGGVGGALLELVLDVVKDFVPIFLAFLGSSYLLQRYEEMRAEVKDLALLEKLRAEVDAAVRRATVAEKAPVRLHAEFDGFDWHGFFDDAREVTILVHYLDSWIRRNERDVGAMLARGGRILLVQPDPENPALVQAVGARLPQVAGAAVQERMRATAPRLRQLAARAPDPAGAVTVRHMDRLPWFSAFRADDERLVLCPDDHTRAAGTGIRSPVVEIDLTVHPEARTWFEAQVASATTSPAGGVSAA